jgi:hypothetical protein
MKGGVLGVSKLRSMVAGDAGEEHGKYRNQKTWEIAVKLRGRNYFLKK